MADKKPLANYSGTIQEVAATDSLAVPSITFSDGTVQTVAMNSPVSEYFWDFPSGYSGGNYTSTALSGGNATTGVTLTEDAGAFGCIGFNCGTTANSGAYLSAASVGISWKLANGDGCKMRLKFANTLLATTKVRFGMQAAFNTNDETHEVSFVMNGGALTGRCRNASSETATATLVTITGDVWYGFKIEYTTTSVAFTVFDASGTQLATASITTNIPSNTSKRPGIIATNSGTTAGRLVLIDYIYTKTATTGRFFG